MLIRPLSHQENIRYTVACVAKYTSTHKFSERRDDFAKCRQWLVDIRPFLESGAPRPSTISSLTACQVYQADLTHLTEQYNIDWRPQNTTLTMTLYSSQQQKQRHVNRVPTLLLTKKSRTFPGLSRTSMRNFPGPFWNPWMLKYKEKTFKPFPLLLTRPPFLSLPLEVEPFKSS